ncbi:DUF5908 family protein [Zoogloea sp.]|uniref:DUF5908 family protein n=1 Tax=Zoogloea sp. TaxID=49181 RepID=UPI00261BFDDA|nr:DUF5908 family protein [Zoogloea sp.]MDD3353015.1 DUF5908 family protein [Zoogloea sp.]
MPLIVDEVIIAVEVGNTTTGGALPPAAPDPDRQALVAECVRQVLDILRQEQEA